MRIYTAHLRRRGLYPDLVLVKEGFCWPAFILSAPWALWHRMWLSALVLLATGAALGASMTLAGLNDIGQGAISLGFAVIVGFLANDLRRRSLEQRGFAFRDVVAGTGLAAAERALLESQPELSAEFRL